MRLLVVMVVVVGPIRYVCNGNSSGGGRWFGHIADVISTVRCVRDLIMVCAIIATMDGGELVARWPSPICECVCACRRRRRRRGRAMKSAQRCRDTQASKRASFVVNLMNGV